MIFTPASRRGVNSYQPHLHSYPFSFGCNYGDPPWQGLEHDQPVIFTPASRRGVSSYQPQTSLSGTNLQVVAATSLSLNRAPFTGFQYAQPSDSRRHQPSGYAGKGAVCTAVVFESMRRCESHGTWVHQAGSSQCLDLPAQPGG